MTNPTATIPVPAKDLSLGDLVQVSRQFARYHSRPEAAGQVLQVVSIETDPRSPGLVGIQVEGFPTTWAEAEALIPTPGQAV